VSCSYKTAGVRGIPADQLTSATLPNVLNEAMDIAATKLELIEQIVSVMDEQTLSRSATFVK